MFFRVPKCRERADLIKISVDSNLEYHSTTNKKIILKVKGIGMVRLQNNGVLLERQI